MSLNKEIECQAKNVQSCNRDKIIDFWWSISLKPWVAKNWIIQKSITGNKDR